LRSTKVIRLVGLLALTPQAGSDALSSNTY
jgi:hypothetical protein